MDSPQLRALVAAARAGREGAFQEILALFGPRLMGYFQRATGSYHDAEDLLGELAVRLLRRIGEYRDQGRFEPWLFRVAANLVRDRIRRQKARPRAVSLDQEAGDGPSLGETLAQDGPGVDSRLRQQEQAQALMAAIERLDERSRQMVLLRHFGQLSFKEIAEIFQCPLGTVLAKVHRALKCLRHELEQADEHISE